MREFTFSQYRHIEMVRRINLSNWSVICKISILETQRRSHAPLAGFEETDP